MEVSMADKAVKLQPDELTPVQRLAQIDKERAELAASIKEAALKKANDAVTELIALGYHFELAERIVATGTKKGFPADTNCKVCGFRTTKPHDARAHKSQPVAAPFNDEELKSRNLVRV